MSAENLANEAEKQPITVTVGDGTTEVTLTVDKKWKRFAYLRCIKSGDLYGALVAAFGEAQAEALDDLDLDYDAYNEVLETLLEALAGTSVGNS